MGGGISNAERWLPLRKGDGNTGSPDRLRMDEKRTHLGGPDPLDYRNIGLSPAENSVRQRALLAKLIGGELDEAEKVATRLLIAFGSIGGVLSARQAALHHIVDDPELAKRLAVARSVVLEGMGEKVHRTRFELTDVSLQQWIVGLFKGLRSERVHLALLDADKRLIFDEPLAEGDLRGVAGNLRRIVGSGIDADASGVVLMHNHPSGSVKPSAADIDETRRIAFLLGNLDLRLEDHLIVSGNSIFSMRGAMLI